MITTATRARGDDGGGRVRKRRARTEEEERRRQGREKGEVEEGAEAMEKMDEGGGGDG